MSKVQPIQIDEAPAPEPAPMKKDPVQAKYARGAMSPKERYNASFEVDARNESDYYTGVKPLGPQRQGMDIKLKEMLRPAYEKEEPIYELKLDDTKSRVGRMTTLCYLATCQGFGKCLCCAPAVLEFCNYDVELAYKNAQMWCFEVETGIVDELPQQIQSRIESNQMTRYGNVKIYPRHMVVTRTKGLSNDIVILPLLAIQKMKVEEVDPGLNYGFTACCAKIRCCALSKAVQRLKIYGRVSKDRMKCCGNNSCDVLEKHIGIACIMTNNAEELMQKIEEAIKATGEKPHGDAFIQMQITDPFGQAFVRGSITVVGREGEAVMPEDAIRVISTEYIRRMQGYELEQFLKSRGYKFDFKGLNLEQLKEEAMQLFNSQYGVRYTENEKAFDSDPKDLVCLPKCLRSKGAKKTSPLCFGCNVPELPALAKARAKKNGEQEPEPDESPAQFAMRLVMEAIMEQAYTAVMDGLKTVPMVGPAINAWELYQEIAAITPNVPAVMHEVSERIPGIIKKCCDFRLIAADDARHAYVFKAQAFLID